MNPCEVAQKNLTAKFKENPCRGIVLGLTESKEDFQICWTMGRSPESKNRVYTFENDKLRTDFAHQAKVENPQNLFYNAMRRYDNFHIVGNGNQTDTIIKLFENNKFPHPEDFLNALRTRRCEPDQPFFTSRITGYTKPKEEIARIAIIKSDPFAKEAWVKKSSLFDKGDITKKELSHRVSLITNLEQENFPSNLFFYELKLTPGLGYCITTYKEGNSKDLEQFEGEPFLIPAKGNLDDIISDIWNNLEEQWRVSIAGKLIKETKEIIVPKIINKYTKEKEYGK